jgi:diacylglycerol kinase family enzyme
VTSPPGTLPESPSPPVAEVEPSTAPLPPRAAKKKMLVIVNPYATTVSDRLKNLVVYALQGRYEVDAVMTEARNHAIEIGREARDGHYDVVVAFGGDGTVNEIAHGLAGTDIPLTVLPGGSTNVFCRTLGIPNDVVDATEHLLGLADNFKPRRIDLGKANGRHFTFAFGVGLDASVVKQVDSRPGLKAKAGPYYFTWAAVSNFYLRYLRDPVQVRVEVDGRSAEGITAIAQNSDPFTYFANQPLRVCENIALDDGKLAVAVLKRAAQRDIPTLAARVLHDRLRVPKHRQIETFNDVTTAKITSASTTEAGDPRPFPAQVDGDYIGEFTEIEVGIDPAAISVVA